MSTEKHSWENIMFVVMPIGKKGSGIAKNFDQIYIYIVKDAVKGTGLCCIRADEIQGANIVDDIHAYLKNCPIVVADLTGQNANVLYEVGYRICIKGKILLLAQHKSDIPFNLACHRVIIYDPTCPRGCHETREAIRNSLEEMLSEFHVGA